RAKRSNEHYGQTLAGAGKSLDEDLDAAALKQTVEQLSTATRKVQRENATLEKKLADSSAEVTRLKEHLEQVRRDATTDALTSLANRKAFAGELGRAGPEADEKGEPLSLAVIDIDHFKGF